MLGIHDLKSLDRSLQRRGFIRSDYAEALASRTQPDHFP